MILLRKKGEKLPSKKTSYTLPEQNHPLKKKSTLFPNELPSKNGVTLFSPTKLRLPHPKSYSFQKKQRNPLPKRVTPSQKEIPLHLLQKKIHPPSPNKKGLTPPLQKSYPFSSLTFLKELPPFLCSPQRVTSPQKKRITCQSHPVLAEHLFSTLLSACVPVTLFCLSVD